MKLGNPGDITIHSNGARSEKIYTPGFDPYIGQNFYPVTERVELGDLLIDPSQGIGVGVLEDHVLVGLTRNV
jgi:hypothetical protein